MRVTGPLVPLLGILVGALGGAIYWLTVQIWPSSVAVIVSMAVTALLTAEFRVLAATRLDLLARVLCLLIKYNALMALSAAKLPFVAPANFPLALIMICGYAASFALRVSVTEIGYGGLSIALAVGFAPAVLLGIPGLIGLASAVIVGMALIALPKYKGLRGSGDALDLTQLTTEACFYLGALASWRFV